ncbi:MAG: TraB/GumN family protein [Planctomycetota bacterium]|nr:TraB/GumN family protein [Planctomycetota bacterium]
MRRFLPILPFFLLPLAAPAVAQEAAKLEPPKHSFLWKVEREGLATSWLFGTIHVPDDRINMLHPEVKAALESADAFYGEIAMDNMDEMQDQLLKVGVFDDGRTLKDVLPEATWKRLDARLGKHGMSAQMLSKFKPFMVSMTLAQLDMLPLLSSGKKTLDERLYKVSQAKGKEVGGVEKIEEQIEALANTLTLEESVQQLSDTLDDMDLADARGISDLERIMRAWLSGSERYILALAMESWDIEDPVDRRFYEALLINRNLHMAARAAKKMKEAAATKFVFAFGTFHFVGERSVVELLRKDGFTVTRMAAPSAEQEEAILASDPWLEQNQAAAELELEPVGAGG